MFDAVVVLLTCVGVSVCLRVVTCAENKGVGVMKPGHAFTIEPMINEGELSCK